MTDDLGQRSIVEALDSQVEALTDATGRIEPGAQRFTIDVYADGVHGTARWARVDGSTSFFTFDLDSPMGWYIHTGAGMLIALAKDPDDLQRLTQRWFHGIGL